MTMLLFFLIYLPSMCFAGYTADLSYTFSETSLAPETATWQEFQDAISGLTSRKTRVLLMNQNGWSDKDQAIDLYGEEAWDTYYAMTEAYVDAPLRAEGKVQAIAVANQVTDAMAAGMPVDYVWTSPLSRAVNTTNLIWAGANHTPVVSDLVRSTTGVWYSSLRSTVSELQQDFPDMDYSSLAEADDQWYVDTRETADELTARVEEWLAQVFASSDVYVALSSHQDFIDSLCALIGHEHGDQDIGVWAVVVQEIDDEEKDTMSMMSLVGGLLIGILGISFIGYGVRLLRQDCEDDDSSMSDQDRTSSHDIDLGGDVVYEPEDDDQEMGEF